MGCLDRRPAGFHRESFLTPRRIQFLKIAETFFSVLFSARRNCAITSFNACYGYSSDTQK